MCSCMKLAIIFLSWFSVLQMFLGAALPDFQHIVMVITLINITQFWLLPLSLSVPCWCLPLKKFLFFISSISTAFSSTSFQNLHDCSSPFALRVLLAVPCQLTESLQLVKASVKLSFFCTFHYPDGGKLQTSGSSVWHSAQQSCCRKIQQKISRAQGQRLSQFRAGDFKSRFSWEICSISDF